jgi:hypothetical protein
MAGSGKKANLEDSGSSFHNFIRRLDMAPARSHDTFSAINERTVGDISIEFFYKPHTITLLLVSILVVLYTAFSRYVSCIDQVELFTTSVLLDSLC